MKKILFIAIVFIISNSLVACGALQGQDLGVGAVKSEIKHDKSENQEQLDECNYKLDTGFIYSKEMIYINPDFKYSLRIPEDIYIQCDIKELNNGAETIFQLKDSGDMVMAVMTIEDSLYDDTFGTTLLNSKNGFTTYIQRPTCGTLNDESKRALWNELCEESATINSSNLTYIE